MNEKKNSVGHDQPRIGEIRPHKLVRHIPLKPHEYTQRITRKEDVFILSHVGIPRADPETWWLEICGQVERPQRFGFNDLVKLPKREVTALHECAGFPTNPRIATRRYANVVWGGIDLATLLSEIGVRPEAKFVWSYGCDYGQFADVTAEVYRKDMPIERLHRGDVLLAYEINGEPLTQELGSPLRLIIPGYYGTNAVKWLYRIELAGERPSGLYTTTYYNDIELNPDGSTSAHPVWEIAPESVIVSPADQQSLSLDDFEIWGWAWAEAGVEHVEVSVDGGKSWTSAALEDGDRWAWRRFSCNWKPTQPATYALMSRATDVKGQTQPLSDRRNSVYQLSVAVV
ncbi:MAG: molybdopterin-dependent oxidoreductase [Afipia sp.]|nr:molybdopterin-dependent oxidoreductase [Afipia sp.]